MSILSMKANNLFKPPDDEESHHRYHTTIEDSIDDTIGDLNRFVSLQIIASILLLFCSAIAILAASSVKYHELYQSIINLDLGLILGPWKLNTNLKVFVNDFLMTLFFMLLGIEIKKSFIAGELKKSAVQRMVFISSASGIVTPILIYLSLTWSTDAISGWGIPTATDTAFALGLLSIFRKKIHNNLFTYVAAFAVLDDVGAILILALFYSPALSLTALGIASTLMLIMVALNIAGVRSYLAYISLGCIMWFFVEHSGLHGTLAGVLTAAVIPARPKKGPKHFVKQVGELTTQLARKEEVNRRTLIEDKQKHEIVERIENLAKKTTVPINRLHHSIEPGVMLFIIPIFVLLNAGIPISLDIIVSILRETLPLSISVALVLGKAIGIAGSCYVVMHFKWGEFPDGVQFKEIIGVSLLAGIGFTMSIFIAEQGLPEENMVMQAKYGVLVASMVSAFMGCAYFTVCQFQKKGAF